MGVVGSSQLSLETQSQNLFFPFAIIGSSGPENDSSELEV